jgi:hypothetical protein
MLGQSFKTALTTAAMVVLAFLVHLILYSGSQPPGAYLLSMFIAPWVAAALPGLLILLVIEWVLIYNPRR